MADDRAAAGGKRGDGPRKPKYKNVNIPTDLWEMVTFVTTVRGQNVGDYLGPLIRERVLADWRAEVARMQAEQDPPPDAPPRRRSGA